MIIRPLNGHSQPGQAVNYYLCQAHTCVKRTIPTQENVGLYVPTGRGNIRLSDYEVL